MIISNLPDGGYNLQGVPIERVQYGERIEQGDPVIVKETADDEFVAYKTDGNMQSIAQTNVVAVGIALETKDANYHGDVGILYDGGAIQAPQTFTRELTPYDFEEVPNDEEDIDRIATIEMPISLNHLSAVTIGIPKDADESMIVKIKNAQLRVVDSGTTFVALKADGRVPQENIVLVFNVIS